MKYKNLMKEFSRYILVGGSAFIVDIALLYIFRTYVFNGLGLKGIYISTALGFTGGLVYNYFLSLIFVFDGAKQNDKGKSFGAFIVFAVIGIAGLLLTEFGMFLGVEIYQINFLITKICVAGLVLIWNYGVRKILIFK